MLSHKEARALISEGYRRCFTVDPTRPQAQLVQAVGWLETQYGAGWSSKIPGAAGSNNWGAVTAGAGWNGNTFEHKDSRPDSKGNNIWYTTKFRAYPTPQDGATDLIKLVYVQRPAVLAAATLGDSLAFSTAMYKSKYFLGFGATEAERIAHHHGAVVSALKLMCRAIGEPMPDGSELPPAPPVTIRQGSVGDAVRAWQSTLIAAGFELVVDGAFGPRTAALTKSLQSELKLVADGVVGPATYAAAAKRFPLAPRS